MMTASTLYRSHRFPSEVIALELRLEGPLVSPKFQLTIASMKERFEFPFGISRSHHSGDSDAVSDVSHSSFELNQKALRLGKETS